MFCGGSAAVCIRIRTKSMPCINQLANYSRRSNSKDQESSYKVVKSRVRVENKTDFLGLECGPNWELLAPKGNRFYFKNSVGPAWQGLTTTIKFDEPLESLVDFEGNNLQQKLKFAVSECPALIKKSLHELFPAPEVVSGDKLALLKLSFGGNCEAGAQKFVLAAREITARLRLHGYWADFMNPFSGKPFFSWANGKNLYKIDSRFRGLNMKVHQRSNCTIISPEDSGFSGVIYTNAPCDMLQIRTLIDTQV